jgi:hypothetical protein
MLSDSLFTDASWLFFTIWSIVVATVSLAAFGPDLLRSKAAVTSSHGTSAQTIVKNRTSRI